MDELLAVTIHLGCLPGLCLQNVLDDIDVDIEQEDVGGDAEVRDNTSSNSSGDSSSSDSSSNDDDGGAAVDHSLSSFSALAVSSDSRPSAGVSHAFSDRMFDFRRSPVASSSETETVPPAATSPIPFIFM